MGPIQGDRCGRGLRRDQRIDDDDSSLTLDQSHVRQVSAPHLVDAVGHLEQALDRGQLTLAPQTRIDGVRGLAPHGVGELVDVEHDPPVGRRDHARLQPRNQPPVRILEIRTISEISH
jgi:hypothetical protein